MKKLTFKIVPKDIAIFLGIAILVCALLYVFILLIIKADEKDINKVNQECPYLTQATYGIDFGFVKCFGIFSIGHETIWLNDKDEISIYVLRDDQHNYNIARITGLEKYSIINNSLYIFDDGYDKVAAPEGKYPGEDYHRYFYVDGAKKDFAYPHLVDVPDYIQVETSTGEVTLYNTYDQMPEEAKLIFQELENNAISESS